MLKPSITESTPVAQRHLWLSVLVAAVLTTMAFPPVDCGWLAWVDLAPLLWAITHAPRARSAFALAYAFGCIHWGYTVTWVGVTVAFWAKTPFGWIAWVLLTAIEALWYGAFGILAWQIAKRWQGVVQTIGLAAVWVLLEWLRAQGSLAMPWSLIGYTQYRILPLIQCADIVGVYGVSALLVLLNAGLVHSLRRSSPGRWNPLLLSAAAVGSALLYGVVAPSRIDPGKPVRFVLTQPNIPSFTKESWPPERQMERCQSVAAMFANLTPTSAPTLVVWPESAVPYDVINDAGTRNAFARFYTQPGGYQIIGAGYSDPAGRVYNSATLMAADGRITDRYDKRWRVPYGEWTPGRRWMPFGSTFHYVEHDVTPGAATHVLRAGPMRLSVLICYESVFPALAANDVANGANLLVSMTNNSWAGQSAELQQHIAMAVFRAVETRRDLVASANTGVTCHIGATGSMRQIAPYATDVMVTQGQLRDGISWYVQHGDLLVGGFAVWLLILLVTGVYYRENGAR